VRISLRVSRAKSRRCRRSSWSPAIQCSGEGGTNRTDSNAREEDGSAHPSLTRAPPAVPEAGCENRPPQSATEAGAAGGAPMNRAVTGAKDSGQSSAFADGGDGGHRVRAWGRGRRLRGQVTMSSTAKDTTTVRVSKVRPVVRKVKTTTSNSWTQTTSRGQARREEPPVAAKDPHDERIGG